MSDTNAQPPGILDAIIAALRSKKPVPPPPALLGTGQARKDADALRARKKTIASQLAAMGE